MIIYLLVVTLMFAGATASALFVVESAMRERRLDLYNAQGFYLLALIFLTFILTTLTYFWGETRFSPVSDQLSEPVVGLLYSFCCCAAGLSYGLLQLQRNATK